MYRVSSRSPRSGGGGSSGAVRRWLLPVALCAVSGGIVLGPALPAAAMDSSPAGDQVASQDAGALAALPGMPGWTGAAGSQDRGPAMSGPVVPSLPSLTGAAYSPSMARPASVSPYDSSHSSDPSDSPSRWHEGHGWHEHGTTVVSTQILAVKIPGSCCHEEPPPPCGCKPHPEHHPKLWIAKSADHKVAKPGDTVTYTVRFRNTGDGPFRWDRLPVITDHLSGVLENASLVSGSLSATTGHVRFNAGPETITWTGQLWPGQSGSFSYQVKVNRLEHEHSHEALDNSVTAPGSNCPPGCRGAECKVHIPIVRKHHKCHHHKGHHHKCHHHKGHHHKCHHKGHHHKGHHPCPQLPHTGAAGSVDTGWAALACLTGGSALSFGARRARR